MKELNGILTFECDLDARGNEIGNSSQRNNELVWPAPADKPKAQYTTTWKNMCNVTSYVMALEYSGFVFPSGPYKQPEDNLGLHILTSKTLMEAWKKAAPAEYNLFMKSLDGKCTKVELNNMYFPTELHKWLCFGSNDWIGTEAAEFRTNVNFRKALWRYLVNDNLPMVVSTIFGGFNHIVCVTGVQYNKKDYAAIRENPKRLDEVDPVTGEYVYSPVAILVDDPWGRYDPNTNKYLAPNGGNDIVVPWKAVVSYVKPCGSKDVKWAHTFTHGSAKI